jgi:anti-sigma factor RsiW
VNCELAFERMLEAGPEELGGRLDSELAAHITQCNRCGAVAAEILAGQEALAQGIRRIQSEGKVEELLAGVRRAAATARRRLVTRVALPLAAAAALAMLIIGDRSTVPPSESAVQIAQTTPRPEQSVRLEPNTNAILFKTSNPKITVVWFY